MSERDMEIILEAQQVLREAGAKLETLRRKCGVSGAEQAIIDVMDRMPPSYLLHLDDIDFSPEEQF